MQLYFTKVTAWLNEDLCLNLMVVKVRSHPKDNASAVIERRPLAEISAGPWFVWLELI